MHYRRLGRTGLAISPIGLGTMNFGPPVSEADAARLVLSARDLGVNWLDTANCYDGSERGPEVFGYAESYLGRILQPNLRDEFVIVSKVGVPLAAGPQHRGLSATHILRELDNSLRRLQTDFIDVYMIHWPDAFANVEEVLRAIDCAVISGKVRYFGISNHQAWQICEYLWIADRRSWPVACVSEIPRSILDRRYENDLPFYSRHEIGVLSYQPLSGGTLTERRVHASLAENAETNFAVGSPSENTIDAKRLGEIQQLAADCGLTISELAIAWAAAAPEISGIVLGARTPEQLANATRAAELAVGPELLKKIDDCYPPPSAPQPRFER
jgi:L-glyceraldehyde 3-phosphate reductase